MAYGLISGVVEPDELESAARQTARELSELPAGFAAAVKSACGSGSDMPLDAGLALEQRLSAAVAE